MMLMLITYDVNVTTSAGRKRLRHISKSCLDYGMRVQYSVFECDITPAQWANLKAILMDIYDEQVDSLRFYHLGAKGYQKVEHHGAKSSPDILRDPLVL